MQWKYQKSQCSSPHAPDKYVDLEKAYYKVLKKYDRYYANEYYDYLEACYQLKYDMKDKKVLYPTDLKKEHDKVMDLLEIFRNEANDKLIRERASILKNNTYSNNK